MTFQDNKNSNDKPPPATRSMLPGANPKNPKESYFPENKLIGNLQLLPVRSLYTYPAESD